MSLSRGIPEPYPPEWVELLAHGTPTSDTRFPAGHFHTAEELQAEVEAAGLEVVDVVGVEGPAGLLFEVLEKVEPALQDAALAVARAGSAIPGIRDQSAHLMAIARVQP